jgi:hypothetical protein
MSVEMAMWRMTENAPEPLATAMLDAEARLEDLVVSDPSLVGLDVLVLDGKYRPSTAASSMYSRSMWTERFIFSS